MEEVGHSRLLKFLLPASKSTNMSQKYEIKFEYVNPSDIESEVPEQQKIREADSTAENSSPERDDVQPKSDENQPENVKSLPENVESQPENVEIQPENIESQAENDEGIKVVEESAFVPVFTVRKHESVFTKGDVKLQEISVTENISEPENAGPQAYSTNQVHSLIHGEVMETQPIRTVPGVQDSTDSGNEEKEHTESSKTKTRIPKFKQTVEKVKKETKDTKEKKVEEVPPTQKRRSSIPKVSKISKIPPGKGTTVKKDPKSPVAEKSDTKIAPAAKSRTILPKGIPLPVKDKSVKKHTETHMSVNDVNVKHESKKTDSGKPENIEKVGKEINLSVKEDADLTFSNVDETKKEIYPEITTGENKAEDDFDKIYDEIFDSEQTQVANNESLTFDDLEYGSPSKIDMNFDEIIHAYDDNVAKPVITEKFKPTNPLMKQKSLHEVVVPKELTKRLSLPDVSNEDADTSQNMTTDEQYETKSTNDANVNRMEEDYTEQHSMIYTNEPALLEMISQLNEKEDDMNQQLDIEDVQEPLINKQKNNGLAENEDTSLIIIPQQLNNTIPVSVKDEPMEHKPEESNIIQEELKETVKVPRPFFKQEIVNQNNDFNKQLRDDDSIRELSTLKQYNSTQIETNASKENRLEENSIEQHSMMYTNEPAQFEIITQVPEIEKDDILNLKESENLQNDLISIQNNDKLEDNEVPQQINVSVKHEVTKYEPEETNTNQRELKETVEEVKNEITEPEPEKINVIEQELQEFVKVATPVFTSENKSESIEVFQDELKETVLVAMPVFKDKPDRIITTQVELQETEKEEIPLHKDKTTEHEIEQPNQIQQKFKEPLYVTETMKVEPKKTEIIHQELVETVGKPTPVNDKTIEQDLEIIDMIQQKVEETVFTVITDGTIKHEPEKTTTTQQELKETVVLTMPVVKEGNINHDVLTRDGISETKHADIPKLNKQKSNSDVPDSSQMVLNIMSLIRGTQDNKDETEELLEKVVPVTQEKDNCEIARNEIEKDKYLNRSLPIHETSITNRIDSNEENIQSPRQEVPHAILKQKLVKSKIAVISDKATSQKEKTNKPPARTINTTTTKKAHGEPQTKIKINAPVVHKSEPIRKKSLDTDKKHSKFKSKNNAHVENVSKHIAPNAANSEIDKVAENNSAIEIIVPVVLDKDKNNSTYNKGPDSKEGGVIKEVPKGKGKVTRIISRLGSQEHTREPPRKELVSEIPEKKSVSSKIAMFENQSSKDKPASKLISDTRLSKPTKESETSRQFVQKPIVIDQVLKSEQPVQNTDIKYHEATVELIRNEAIFTAGHPVVNEINYNLIDDNVFEHNAIPVVNDMAQPTHNVTNKDTHNKRDYKVISNKATGMPSIESRLERMRSLNDQSNMRRTKSVAELDLGDAVKGRVHQMIVRINSMENLLDIGKREINVKERPGMRSISEKIALFERKLTPVNMNEATETRPDESKTNRKLITSQDTVTEEAFNERVAELTNAKIKYGRMDQMICMPLSDGSEMPALSVGTALLNPRLIRHVIGAAIDLGYRAIDTAFIYGNEKEVGEAIRAKIADGTVTREELYITSKLWSTYHRQDLVEPACRASLAALGLEYFDLYLIHNPMSFKEGGDPVPKIANVLQYSECDYMDAWYGMESLVSKGLVKSIGVSNFNAAQISRVYEKGRVKPVVNQVECHPYLNQQRLDQHCSERNILLSCYGVLGSKGTPGDLKSHQSPVIDDPLVKVMAAALDVTPAQLLIRYQIESGHSIVVKSSTAAHLWDNLQTMSFNISSTELDALNALNRNKRTYTFKGMGDTHRNYPFRGPY